MEGIWVAKSMSQYMEKTVYKTIEEAIKQKKILVEKTFAFYLSELQRNEC